MTSKLSNNIDLDNHEFQQVWSLIQHTHTSVFLTGKAGTGKSTFLKYICKNTKKKYVVLAPTGLSAVNVGGQTLHSFFKIPFKPLLPDDPDFSPRRIRETLRYNKKKVKLIQELELIIIDEISMVRADIIDFIDKVLRIYSNNTREPFGGKQLLFVGDIFQLEPVVTRDMRDILRRWYPQFFFFNAKVFSQLGLVPIELRKAYRQTDSQFVELLDRVRINHATPYDINALNTRYNPAYNGNGEFVITLATRRDTVDAINEEHMDALPTPEIKCEGKIEGNFPENDLPTSKDLVLKEGAQVIFIRNNKEGLWVNGTIGKIHEVADRDILVELEDGSILPVEPEKWENIQYEYDEKEKKVIEHVLGTFSQLPIKPAWALTIHKSQGQTFNNVVIDLGGGAFTSGQTYVALSRCTSLEGITLLRPLQERDIILSNAIVEFSRHFNNDSAVAAAFEHEKAMSLYRQAAKAFDANMFKISIKFFSEAMAIKNELGTPAVQRLIALKMQKFNNVTQQVKQLERVIAKQNAMLQELAAEYTHMGNQSLGYGDLVTEDEVTYGGKKKHLDEIATKSALANFNKALKLCPDNVDAMLGKANIYIITNQLDKAERTYEDVLKIEKDNYEAHMGLGEIYSLRNDTQEAIKSYKRAIRADKKAPQPHEQLAGLYDHIGLENAAEEEAEIAKALRKKQKGPKRKSRNKR